MDDPGEISRESGLRQDLVSRFVPGMDTPSGKLYSAGHVALARYVKELTDLNVPSAAVQVAVHDMESRPAAEFDMLLRHKGTIRVASGRIGAAAAAALLIGGIAGGSSATAPQTKTTPPRQRQRRPPSPHPPNRPNQSDHPDHADPVCAEWAPLADSYASKQSAWGQRGGDPQLRLTLGPRNSGT
ncbi:hypothetical protein I553_3389 [Mycobacterium xenopi 4042]|uniref:Uncharacterized protein n=1 Tax=Mycobacterium xenopi 4042 TaxID=1299334 RepID=X8BE13_MYCXE|nr:hypothetical protein I553_3389 [Mycobacterium xenopi 4042]